MIQETVYWLTAAASLVAVILNIHRRVACFWIWSGTNAVWCVADLCHGLPQQALVQLVYFGLSLYGLSKWSKAAQPEGPKGVLDGRKDPA